MKNNIELPAYIDVINDKSKKELDADALEETREPMGGVENVNIDKPKESRRAAESEDQEENTPQGIKISPRFFTDQKGNLKVVNLVVRYPCLVFFLILAVSLVVSFLLVKIVFNAGNPFAEPGSEYDIHDIRSTAYDSFRLAQEEVVKKRAAITMLADAKKVRVQEDYLDVTYWVFEGETEDGLFSSANSISAMKEALDLFNEHEDYESFCWKFYIDIPFTNSTISQCRPLLSALNMYYASSWDIDKVQSVIDQLSNSNYVEIYNGLSLCLEYGSYCELVPAELQTDENKQWFQTLNNNVTSILMKLDGKGELKNDNIDQMTLFAAHLMKLNTKRGIVDFFYDKNFNADNPISMYSRAMINWGGPLNITSVKSDDDETDRIILKQ